MFLFKLPPVFKVTPFYGTHFTMKSMVLGDITILLSRLCPLIWPGSTKKNLGPSPLLVFCGSGLKTLMFFYFSLTPSL